MKITSLTLCLLFFCTGVAFAQKFKLIQPKAEAAVSEWKESETGDLYYQEIIEIPNQSKKTLFQNSELFLVKAYNNAKNVTQTKSKEDGYLLVKGLLPITLGSFAGAFTINVEHILRIDLKDGKARVRFTVPSKVTMFGPSTYPFTPPKNNKPDAQERAATKNFYITHRKVKRIMEDLKEELSVNNGGDDW